MKQLQEWRLFKNMKNCTTCNKKIDLRSIGNLCSKCLNIKNLNDKFDNWLLTGDLGIKIGTTVRWGMRDKLS